MGKMMAAMALSFLMAAGGGAALADSNSGSQGSSSGSGSQRSGQTSGSQASGQHGNRANGQAPVGFAEEEVKSAPFTIERVDKKNQQLVLRAPDGTQSTMDVPSGTPGFDSLKKGDKVELDYFAAAVFGAGNQQGNRANHTGSMPSGGSNQAKGSTSGNNNIGRVNNIRKLGQTGSTSHSGNNTGNKGNRSGTEMGNQGTQ